MAPRSREPQPHAFTGRKAPGPAVLRGRSKAALAVLACGAVVAVAGVAGAATGSGPAGPATSTAPTVSPSASTSPAPGVTDPGPDTKVLGDSRKVTEPKLPTTVCAEVKAAVSLTGRVGSLADETAPPDTERVQKAIDGCAQTGTDSVAVKLLADGTGNHHDFLIAPITVKQGVVLVIDSDVTVYGARNAALYQAKDAVATCGKLSLDKDGCVPLITVKGANAGIEGVRARGGRQGTIDGRADLTILGQDVTWWDQAHAAQVQNTNQNNPRLIVIKGGNFTLYHVTLKNPAQFTVSFQKARGFTAWGVQIKTPATARNTDGIDPSGASDVTIRDSFISTGDDCIAIKGAQPTSNITIRNVHCYGTHGISIGSETNGGVSSVLVQGNTIDGKDGFGNLSREAWGIRIKSNSTRGGLVKRIGYLDNCVRNAMGPMIFDTRYDGGVGTVEGPGTLIPEFTQITVKGLVAVNSQPGAYLTFSGVDSTRPLNLRIQDAVVDAAAVHAEHARLKLTNTNLTVSGPDVETTVRRGDGKLPRCTFPTFPRQ